MTESEFMAWLKAHRDSVRTPSYIYSEELLDASLANLRSLVPPGTRTFYSLKANPQPGVMEYLARSGVGGEIASGGEHYMCMAAQLRPTDVLVGGVSKSKQYLAEMCERGSAGIVVESPGEWNRLQQVLGPTRRSRVFFRINPGVALGGLDMAGESQFGLDVAQGIELARQCLANPHAEFAGLHFYFGSQRLTGDPIVKMVTVVGGVLDTFRDAGIKVNTVDLGLGCGVPYLDKDTSLDLDALRPRLMQLWAEKTWSSVQLWTEAGRSLVGRSGYYVSRVLERKVRGDVTFIFLDGGLHTHNPGIGVGRFFRSNPRFLFLTGRDDSGSLQNVDIVGNLCTSADSLGRKVPAPKLEEGDLIVIPNSGAYCQTTALWGFNGQPLFTEGLLDRQGALRWVEPQYSVLIKRPSDAAWTPPQSHPA